MTRTVRTAPSLPRSPLAAALVLALAGALALAACGSPSPTGTPPAATDVATPEPTFALPSGLLGSPALPSPGFSFQLPSVDAELEAVLPDEVAGQAVSKGSMSGESLVALGGSDDLEEVLATFEKTPEDLTAAIGSTADVIMFAFRIDGVPASGLYDAFVAAIADGSQVITDTTIAGKAVKQVVDPTGAARYLYFVDDVLVTVSGIGELDDATLAEIFEALP